MPLFVIMSQKNRNRPENNSSRKPGRNLFLPVAGSVAAAALAGTLFYSCINDWQESPGTESVSQGAARYPSMDDIASLDQVSEIVEKKGQYPDVIILAQSHPRQVSSFKNAKEGDTRQAVESICAQLYDKYGIRSLMLEGIYEGTVREYMLEGAKTLRGLAGSDLDNFLESYHRILGQRKWMLSAGESTEIGRLKDAELAPIVSVHKRFKEQAIDRLEHILNELGKFDGKIMTFPPKEVLNEEMDKFNRVAVAEAQRELEQILTPEKVACLYDLAVARRERSYAAQISRLKESHNTPVIVVLGESHRLQDILEGMSYIVIRPKGHIDAPIAPSSPELLRNTYLIMPSSENLLRVEGNITPEGKFVMKR
jgi:hypothetical protein